MSVENSRVTVKIWLWLTNVKLWALVLEQQRENWKPVLPLLILDLRDSLR